MENSINKIVSFVVTYKRLFIIIGVIFVLYLIIRSFLLANAIVVINVESNIQKDRITVSASTDSSTYDIGQPGFYILNRSVKSLIVSASDYTKTQTDIEVPWYGFMIKTVKLENDLNADKVAYRSTTGAACATYSNSSDRLSYFTCDNPTTLVRYDTPKDKTWVNTKVSDILFANGKAVPYMGGVLGITATLHGDASKNIVHTNENGGNTGYSTPEQLATTDLTKVQIFTDTGNSRNNKFVFVDKVGTIFLATPTASGEVSYKTIPAPKNYKVNYNQTLCAISDDNVYCYRGVSPVGDPIRNEDNSNLPGYSIVKASFTDEAITEKKIENISYPLGKFVVAGGKFFGKSYENLVTFDESGNSYNPRSLAQNIVTLEGGDKARYIQKNGMFEYDDARKESHQMFYSPNINPQSLYYVDGKVFIIGNVAENKTITYAYLLNSTPNSASDRLIDVLPASIPGAYSIDFIGNTVSVTLSDIYARTQTRTLIDNNKVNSAKEKVMNSLQSKGIATDNLTFEFTY